MVFFPPLLVLYHKLFEINHALCRHTGDFREIDLHQGLAPETNHGSLPKSTAEIIYEPVRTPLLKSVDDFVQLLEARFETVETPHELFA
jgi:hypothetical protein